MNTKMQSMKDNQVWYLVVLLSNGRTVGCKWLFKKKTDMNGNVHTFKARLVAKGITQTYRVDYRETFSHVADIRAIRILLAIAAFYDYEIWQMDVKTFFLNGHLSEDQASRSWNKRFDEEIKKIGFSQNPNEPYLGEATYILGIKIIRDISKRLIALSQSACLEKILKKFRMENSKKGYTPMMENPDYRKSQCAKTPTEVQRMQRVPYASAIDIVLVYGAKPEDELKVSCYANASFQTDKDDTKSQTGYVFVLNGVMPSNKRPMEMLCDNEPALAIASDPGILKGARHFQRKYHYIRKVIQEGEIVLKKVHTDDNVTDPFTKPMPFSKHFEHAITIGIVLASSLM
ncbi:retrotransposon protein, putative, ty1-copia subclass [Tanacetum coccineum]